MKKVSKKNILILNIIILLVIISIIIFIPSNEPITYIPYKEFINNVELNMVESVEMQESEIKVKLKGDNRKYYTDNPETNDLKEYLLLYDVSIVDTFGTDDFEYILDMVFYLLFFGVIGFGIYKIISFNNKTFKVIKNNTTKFSDVVGMTEIKKDMLKTVEILKNPKEYEKKGIRAPKGIILEGPPGNGKTLFAKALSGEANINFIATKGADFQSSMMSIGPRKIKTLFKKARKSKPCIIFIDEFDGIGERRNYAGTGVDKENNRIITAMLNEMDGFNSSEGVLVIAATNSYASLDAALVRPGRFDRKYKVGNPTIEDILKLIDLYTKKKRLADTVNKEMLAKCFNGLSCAAIETILNEAATEVEIKNETEITMEDIVSAGKKTNTVNIKLK